jgi:hypothetical protein
MDIVMRIVIGVIAAVALGVGSLAQATDPPTSPAPQAATTTPADTADATAKADSAKQAATQSAHADSSNQLKLTAGDPQAEAQLKRFRAAGYKPEVHDGNVVFCRREAELGSRFDKKVCTTAHLLEQQMSQAQDTLSSAQRNGTLMPRSN